MISISFVRLRQVATGYVAILVAAGFSLRLSPLHKTHIHTPPYLKKQPAYAILQPHDNVIKTAKKMSHDRYFKKGDNKSFGQRSKAGKVTYK
ncbi:MAG: hypothetical protein D4R73_04460 [Deltaproteobacteria bacterium]|nr:MAG: hypothetical protein D4R73_04460 [Deltaproteobacteria bacterium]